MCAQHIENYDLAYDIYCKMLTLQKYIVNHTIILNQRKAVCIPHIEDKYTYYNRDIVNKICMSLPRHTEIVTFTITSRKRFDLFERTVNSFLNCCTDLDKIDRWLCVDDNSSEEDRQKGSWCD